MGDISADELLPMSAGLWVSQKTHDDLAARLVEAERRLDEAVRLLRRLRAPETSHERDAIDAFLSAAALNKEEQRD